MFKFNKLKKIPTDPSAESHKSSYAQCGEDLIVDFLFTHLLSIKQPNYLDIGAHHPYHLSNTYLFYKRGCRGVSIEPDPSLFKEIVEQRPGDVNINMGVGFKKEQEDADFFIMSYRALNTFSKAEAERMAAETHYSIAHVEKIPLININDILGTHFPGNGLDFLSLDVEGLDLDILKSIDFELHQPKVICVETIVFSEDRKISKLRETIDFIVSKGYHNYADTSINTIFVKRELLERTEL